MKINGRTFLVSGKLLRTAVLEDEWYLDVNDPETLVQELRQAKAGIDIISFWQRLPNCEPKFPYHWERDPVAALPISDYSNWLEKQIDAAARNKVRKAGKKGVTVKVTTFDDNFVRGITAIFNETPIRQGRPFLHYGKSFDTVKQQFSRFLFREELLAAYVGDELVGFVMLADAGTYAYLGQIISKVAHRDKSPTNALLAKAVERCAEKRIPYLAYGLWLDDSLGDFKKSNGFHKYDLPRYYVPLSNKGELAIRLGAHRGWKTLLPESLKTTLKALRSRWYATKTKRMPSKLPRSGGVDQLQPRG